MRCLLPLLLAGLLPALCVAPAAAGGVGLTWGDYCSWTDAGTCLRTWSCRSDTTSRLRMTCSFRPIRSHSDLIGVYVSLVGLTDESSVRDWWQLGSGGCREGALSLSTDGSAVARDTTICADPWGGRASGILGDWEINGSYIGTSATCTLTEPVAIEAERTYFACQFRVDARGTVSGECPGCASPWIFAVLYVELRFAGGAAPEVLDEAWVDGYRCVLWQNPARSDYGCYSDTGVPVRNSTWGQIKSLYR